MGGEEHITYFDKGDQTDEFWRSWKTTDELQVADTKLGYIIGQPELVDAMKLAAHNRRHVLVVGLPGTGKSLAAKGLAEELGRAELKSKYPLEDIVLEKDKKDPKGSVKVKVFPSGGGKKYVEEWKRRQGRKVWFKRNWLFIFLMAYILLIGFLVITVLLPYNEMIKRMTEEDIEAKIMTYQMTGTEAEQYRRDRWTQANYQLLGINGGFVGLFVSPLMLIIFIGFFGGYFNRYINPESGDEPVLVLDTSDGKVPYVDATGLGAEGFFGTIEHDPWQSGGLGTPAHKRVRLGAVHKAHNGILYVDEILTILRDPTLFANLRTVMEDKKAPIKFLGLWGSGAQSVITEPIPANFVLVAGCNDEALKLLDEAFRSRTMGGGLEVYVRDKIADTPDIRRRYALFPKQVKILEKEEKGLDMLPFSREATIRMIEYCREMGGGKDFTLRLRGIRGLCIKASDVAERKGKKVVEVDDFEEALKFHKSIEAQIILRGIEEREPTVYVVEGECVGRANGVGVINLPNGELLGRIIPIEASVIDGGENEVYASGGLGEIAKESVNNVLGCVRDIKELGKKDFYVHFVGAHGVEGDSASIACAVAVMSAITKRPVRQDTVLTGSLSVRGEVLPVGGVHAKIRAAEKAGAKAVIIPEKNMKHIIPRNYKIQVIPVSTIWEVFSYCLRGEGDGYRGI
jgi:Lon-like ATP-dependent protease